MKHTKILILAGLLLCAAGVRAERTESCVVVQHTDGQNTEVVLADQPTITFRNDMVTLTTDKVVLQMPVDEVRRAYVSKGTVTDAITPATKGTARIAVSDDGLAMSGLQAGSTVTLYTADGRQLATARAAADGTLTMNVGQKGLVIVKTNNQSFKLIRK